MEKEKETVFFGRKLTGATREERVAEYNANWEKAEAASSQGKVICISDLIAQAEQLLIENIE